MPWGFVAAAVVGAVASSDSSRRAANTQADAANAANKTENDQFQQNREDLAPWREAGMGALDQLKTGTQPGGEFTKDFTLADFNKDPGYQFRIDEGMRGLEGSAAARGNLLSGGALKGITKYGQDYASGEYQNAYNRYNNDLTTRFNRLSGLAGTSQTATRDVADMGSRVASNTGQNMIGAGNARASGYIGQSNALNQGLSGIQSGYQLSQLNRNQAVQPNYVNWNSGTGGASSSGSWGGSTQEPWYG